MGFKMIYDTRNRDNIDKLADVTKQKTLQLYQYCIDNKIQILIYETIRTKAQQALYVKQGKSKTMNSWHLTGQALDWVLVDSKGNALWNGYNSTSAQKVIKYAKSIGFTSGYDWGWDAPHIQYDKIAYGKDTFGKLKPSATPPTNNSTKKDDEIMKFTSTTTKEAVRDHIEQMVNNGHIGKQWLTDFDNGKMTDGDYDGLRLISDQKKQNNK